MERSIDGGLQKLKGKLLLMGGYVEKAVEEATQGLITRVPERFKQVYEIEDKINTLHREVDEDCLKLLATQSPLGKDLRLIVAVIKINTDLERMGDQAVNISYNGEKYIKEEPLKPLIDIPRMADAARKMVNDSLNSFVNQDEVAAHKVLKDDDFVDSMKDQIFRELLTYMMSDPRAIQRAMCLILIARNLERLADHATNIAEDVIFVASGKDIRHGHLLT